MQTIICQDDNSAQTVLTFSDTDSAHRRCSYSQTQTVLTDSAHRQCSQTVLTDSAHRQCSQTVFTFSDTYGAHRQCSQTVLTFSI